MPPPPRALENAICRPSGDHAGYPSKAGSLVRRNAVTFPTILTYISKFSPLSPSQANATCVPSGENAGVISLPGYVVSGTTRGGGRGARSRVNHSPAPAVARTPAATQEILPHGLPTVAACDAVGATGFGAHFTGAINFGAPSTGAIKRYPRRAMVSM